MLFKNDHFEHNFWSKNTCLKFDVNKNNGTFFVINLIEIFVKIIVIEILFRGMAIFKIFL
jgi:hypothetical protein